MNYANIVGRMVKDPELKKTQSGMSVVEFTLAENVKRKEGAEYTNFFDCVAFGKRGEVIAKYVKKGDKFNVSGNLKQERWESKDGSGKRSKIVVIVNDFEFCGGSKSSGDSQQITTTFESATPFSDIEAPF